MWPSSTEPGDKCSDRVKHRLWGAHGDKRPLAVQHQITDIEDATQRRAQVVELLGGREIGNIKFAGADAIELPMIFRRFGSKENLGSASRRPHGTRQTCGQTERLCERGIAQIEGERTRAKIVVESSAEAERSRHLLKKLAAIAAEVESDGSGARLQLDLSRSSHPLQRRFCARQTSLRGGKPLARGLIAGINIERSLELSNGLGNIVMGQGLIG